VLEWRSVQCSYSQFAEDLLIQRALEGLGRTESAYYVDVGAFDPVTYSNTLLLNQRGWSGINIDAQAKHVARFQELRSGDVNLHLAVSRQSGTAEFLCYDSGTTGRLATTTEGSTESVLGEAVREVIRVPTEPLAAVLEKHAPKGREFGFLSVDCEGADFEVLQSNDWTKFRPWIIAVEDHEGEGQSEVDRYCRAQGYEFFALAHVTKLFTRRDAARV
jgi:FkbM family methyltransferase